MSKVEALEAELAVARIEERFLAAKAAGKLTEELRAELRAAREHFRANHRGLPEGTSVQPATVETTAAVS